MAAGVVCARCDDFDVELNVIVVVTFNLLELYSQSRKVHNIQLQMINAKVPAVMAYELRQNIYRTQLQNVYLAEYIIYSRYVC